jgi:UDP-N-acetyl-2-amino-2-deoxyglucuronate dehydrogenase
MEAQRKLRVALVGCGRISTRYQEAFKELKDEIEVVAAVDSDLEKAKAFAKDFGALSFKDYRDLFALNLDVVHLALPHNLHAPVALDCLNHGIHVLVEKPMALTLADADQMILTAKRNDRLLGCIFQTRYNESVQILKKMKERGDFGKILSVRSILTWGRSKNYYDQSPWKGHWEGEGGGVLIDQAIHSLDRVLYLLGEKPVQCACSIHNYAHQSIETEDTAEGSILFESGTLYSFYATDCYGGNSPINIEFLGEKGSFGLNQDVGFSLINGVRQEYRGIEPGSTIGEGYWGTRHVMELRDFYHCVLEKKPFALDGEEGRKTLELVKGLYVSAFREERVHFPFVDLDLASHPEMYQKIKL